jgi:hypothetical protein
MSYGISAKINASLVKRNYLFIIKEVSRLLFFFFFFFRIVVASLKSNRNYKFLRNNEFLNTSGWIIEPHGVLALFRC